MAIRGANSATPTTEPGAGGQAVKWQSATVTRIERRSPRVSSFFFDLPEPFDFIPGQHADLRLTAPDGYRAQRSYSIASAPGQAGPIELAIEKLDDGEVSPFFHEVVEIGDKIDLRGPIGGHFVWTEADGGPLLLIGAGSGVAPLMCMIRYRALRHSKVPAALLFSARTREECLFSGELDAFDAANDGFHLTVTLTRDPAAGGRYLSRRIDAEMIRDVIGALPSPPALVFVCGSNAFVNVAADAAIEAGVPRDVIRTERYGT